MILEHRLLAVIAHPDDEAFAFAGLLAFAGAQGSNVRVVCMTDGEAGNDRRVRDISRDELAAIRRRELRDSCDALGIAPPTFVGLPDGTLATSSLERVRERISEELKSFVPHVVVSLGYDGAYGHADHIAVAMSLRDAVDASPWRAPRVLHSAFSRGLFQPVCERLMHIPNSPIPPKFDAQSLGCGRLKVDLRLDISAFRSRKLAAISAHASQLRGGDPRSFLIPGIVDTLLDEEWYTVAMGDPLPEGATSPFDGM